MSYIFKVIKTRIHKPEYNEILDTKMGRPHVVILGAGASLAAFPNGDRNGKLLPLMNNLMPICRLDRILELTGVQYDSENFEEIYSDLYDRNDDSVLYDLEVEIFKYFYSLKLPDYPTLYDYLAISLRPKDLIATFNWDPLLWQALQRNHHWAPGPYAVFLHGNTAIGYCAKDRTFGGRGAKCSKCNITYENSKLLYPIKKKEYNLNPLIQSSWSTLKDFLEHAYILTIFGYGAPETDVEAIKLMKEGWGDRGKRELEQTEIIDTKDPDTLHKTWDPFIHTHHYEVHSSFYDSIIARHPRRSCEATWAMLMELQFLDDCPISVTQDWSELKHSYSSRLDFEKKQNQ